MDQNDPEFKRGQLEKAIAAQEALRGRLDDVILDVTLAALRKQLQELNPEPVVEQQRKQVTVLFMDVVGSTSVFGAFDPEVHMLIMDNALQRLAEPVREHGGKVTHFMGDGFLAVFGLPRAQEDDPEMAVRSGLGILDTARLIAQDLSGEYQIEGFQVRIGVNTGLVAVGGVTEAENTIIGAAVNLAARLENAAPPGGLLISQYTYQHVRGIFDLYPGKSIHVKGFTEPVQVYQVQRPKPHSFRFQTRGVEGIETLMVGREQEYKGLQAAVERVGEDQHSQFVTVVGEAGVGKSRLLDEFEKWLDGHCTPALLLKGRATVHTANLPYELLRDLLVSHFNVMDDDPTPVVMEKITTCFRRTLGEEKEFERDAHFVGQLLNYDFHDSPYLQGVLENPQQLRNRAVAYLLDFFRAQAALGLLVVFLDDIHWADESSLDVFERIRDELGSQPILFVCLTRPTLFERRQTWGAGTHHRLLRLQPLTAADSERLLDQVLHKVDQMPDRLFRMILQFAEGNPFYIEELVRMLVEDGVIVKNQSTWQVHPDRLAELNVPATLVGVVQARLDRLPDDERTALQQASVVGRVFWDSALIYMNREARKIPGGTGLTGSHAAQVDEVLLNLQELEMVRRGGASTFSETVEFMFQHAILQEVTYDSVLKRTRGVYHAQVADWLISQSKQRAGEHAGLIAGHLEKAGRNPEALEFLTLAAERAAANYAIEEAVDFYTRALDLTPQNDLERRYHLLMGKEDVLRMQADRVGQRHLLEILGTVVDSLGDPHKRAALLLRKAWLEFWTSEIEAGLAIAQEAASLSEAIGDQSLCREAYFACAWLLVQTGEPELASEKARTALTLARQVGDRKAEGNLLNVIGQTSIMRGDFFSALGYLNEFLRITQEIGDLDREITARNNLGAVLARLGDFNAARQHFEQNLAITQEIGYLSLKSTAFVNLGWISSLLGEWELARAYAEQGVAMKREQQHAEALAEGLVWLGHAWLGTGNRLKAETAYRESLAIRQELDQTDLAMWVTTCLAQVALEERNLTAARAYIEQVTAYLDNGGNFQETWEPLRIYLTCYRVLLACGDSRAERMLATAHHLLQEQAKQIQDPVYRQSFLNNIPWHHEIVETWESRNA